MSWPSLPSINLKVPMGLGVAEVSSLSNAIIRNPNIIQTGKQLAPSSNEQTFIPALLIAFEISSG
jgi:hypothetical protein